jgi:hypothetical protein
MLPPGAAQRVIGHEGTPGDDIAAPLQIATKGTMMVVSTPIFIQAKAFAATQMSNLQIAAKAIVVVIVIYYGTLLDLLSGTKED